MNLEFFATCLPGLEDALAEELHEIGIGRVRPLKGGAALYCEAEDAMRACLWSRLAARIMLVLARVDARDADALYEGVRGIAWEDVIATNAGFNVRGYGTNDELRNTRFTALKAKDAISDRLREKRLGLSSESAQKTRVGIDVRIRDDRATISLDFSGESLGHRSYLSAEDGEDAALSCILSAAALRFGGWHELAQGCAAFVDPACREGFMLVEAASIACDRAPGLGRERWGFEGWPGLSREAWEALEREAASRFEAGLARLGAGEAVRDRDAAATGPDLTRVAFVGTSTSSPLISRARGYVRRAGMRDVVSVEICEPSGMAALVERVMSASLKSSGQSSGVRDDGAVPVQPFLMVASNIDAAKRSDAAAYVQADEAAFAAACRACPPNARFVAMNPQGVRWRFGCDPDSRRRMGKGRVESTVEVYGKPPAGCEVISINDPAGGAPLSVEVFEKTSDQFAARLRKVFKERRKWAKRTGVSCYRIYDADLLDFAVAIDYYAGADDARGNAYLHIAEYAPPASVDADKARRRFADVQAIAPIVCSVRPDHVFSKTRVREKGGSQYRSAGRKPYVVPVEEGGFTFEVDLAGHLDTGLFLDHRPTRKLIFDEARDARFLNLFAYTGSASVYAAGGGASSTVTVDMSQTYLDWARRNMERNGFGGRAHRFEKSDAMRWITEARRAGKRFDLVFVDPPTFSNSKAMGKKTWDVQRDHVELLIGVSRLLDSNGKAVFSCNLRSFKPDVEGLARYGVSIEDITDQTIPEDFARNSKIHKCYIVRRA